MSDTSTKFERLQWIGLVVVSFFKPLFPGEFPIVADIDAVDRRQ